MYEGFEEGHEAIGHSSSKMLGEEEIVPIDGANISAVEIVSEGKKKATVSKTQRKSK